MSIDLHSNGKTSFYTNHILKCSIIRLQNSRIFCERERRSIFERKVWSECKNSEGESRASHSRITLAYVASRLPKTYENDCFAVYASTSSDQFSHASTFEITNGEQQALRKFSASWNLSLLKRCLLSG